MLKNKLSHLAILDEQLERLQQSANVISAITGQDIETVEGAIVSLLTQRAADKCQKCAGSGRIKEDYNLHTCPRCNGSGQV